METISELDAAGVNHVLLTQTSAGWQASIGKKGSQGYTVATDREPGLALFSALQRAGLSDGPTWRHPNPLQRLKNALDRNYLLRLKLGA